MVTNDDIMEMLKLLLEKVEKLESIKADNVSVTSGQITIHVSNGTIDIQGADGIVIQTGQDSPVSIEQAGDVSVNAPAAENVHVKCDGDIEGELTVCSNSVDKVSIECNGDVQGDVLGNASNGFE